MRVIARRCFGSIPSSRPKELAYFSQNTVKDLRLHHLLVKGLEGVGITNLTSIQELVRAADILGSGVHLQQPVNSGSIGNRLRQDLFLRDTDTEQHVSLL